MVDVTVRGDIRRFFLFFHLNFRATTFICRQCVWRLYNFFKSILVNYILTWCLLLELNIILLLDINFYHIQIHCLNSNKKVRKCEHH